MKIIELLNVIGQIIKENNHFTLESDICFFVENANCANFQPTKVVTAYHKLTESHNIIILGNIHNDQIHLNPVSKN